MQSNLEGLGGITKLKKQFLHGLPSRIANIRQRHIEISRKSGCDCEFLARVQRVFDLAALLDIPEFTVLQEQFVLAQRWFQNNGDVQQLDLLLSKLAGLSSETVGSANQIVWSDLPYFVYDTMTGSCDIHLLMDYQYDQYLDQYFSFKGCNVRIHRHPQELREYLLRNALHVVVIDDEYCRENSQELCSLMDSCSGNHIAYIMFCRQANFEKRLLLARHGARLICDPVLDEQKIKLAIEKEVALKNKNSNSVLVVSDDADLLDALSALLMCMGLKVEGYSKPSDEMISMLQRSHFDLVLIDYFLDSMNGFELSTILRQYDEFAYLPVAYIYPRLTNDCDIHNNVLLAESYMLNVFESQLLAESVLAILYESFVGRRVGRYVDEARRENESRRRVLDAHSIVSVADVSGNIIDVNQKFCETSGYGREELIGKNHRIVNSGIHPKEFFRDMWRTILSGKTWHGEICNKKKNGELYWVESTIMPILDEGGKPYQFISARTEVTRIKKIENELRISEDRLMRSQSFANIGTWDWNIKSGGLYWSPKIGPLFGYNVGDLETTYENFLNAVHPDDRAALTNAVEMCLRGDKEYEIEHRTVWPDGTVKWLLERGDVVRDSDGSPLHMLGVVMDITERKNAEIALKESEDRLKEAQHKGKIGHWTWNVVTGDLIWSDEIYRIFGKKPDVFAPGYDHCCSCVHPEDRQLVDAAEQQLLMQKKEISIDYRLLLEDGSIRWVHDEATIKEICNGKVTQIFGTLQDITERKNSEEQNKRQQRLIDILRNGLGRYIQDNNISKAADYMLAGLLEITGSQFGIIGEILYDGNSSPYLKTHAISNIAWDQQTMDFYLEHYKDGMEFRNLDNLIGHALSTGKPVISNDPAKDDRSGGLPEGHPPIHSFLAKPVYHGNKPMAIYCLANKTGGFDDSIIEFLRPFSVTYSSIVNAARMAEMQKQTMIDLEESRREAVNASRAKSQFLSSMSHELRTPLNAILGFSQLLEMNLEQNLSLQQMDSVSEIKKAGEHLLSLINEILDLTRIEAGKIDLEIESVVVKSVIQDCINTVMPLAERNTVTIHFFVCEEILCDQVSVLANRLRLKQVMLNLLSNAIKYNRPAGEVFVDLCVHEHNRLRISVRDTGVGIPHEKQGKVFESFNRLGAESTEIEGTGIGLVICKKIIELMGGEIGFNSIQGEGSCFWIELCMTSPMTSRDGRSNDVDVIAHLDKAETKCEKKVIYIEDNQANIRLMENVFDQLNHIQLESVSDSKAGLEMINKHKPDMVMLDINMPDMDGYQILSQLKNDKELKSIPVIAISANAMPKDIEKGLRHGFDQYVTKPIDVPRLLDIINESLNLEIG